MDEELRQRYMQEQMDVLRPYDIEEEQRLASSVFGRGRGGLSVGAGGQPYRSGQSSLPPVALAPKYSSNRLAAATSALSSA